VTGFRVMSLTEKIPNCIADRLVGCTHNYSGYMTAHVLRPCPPGGHDPSAVRNLTALQPIPAQLLHVTVVEPSVDVDHVASTPRTRSRAFPPSPPSRPLPSRNSLRARGSRGASSRPGWPRWWAESSSSSRRPGSRACRRSSPAGLSPALARGCCSRAASSRCRGSRRRIAAPRFWPASSSPATSGSPCRCSGSACSRSGSSRGSPSSPSAALLAGTAISARSLLARDRRAPGRRRVLTPVVEQ